MLADASDRTGIKWIDQAILAGFKYIEPPLAEFMNLSEGKLREVESRLKNSKIKIEAFCNLFPAGIHLTGPQVDFSRIDGYMEQALALADRFGAECVVFGSGAARRVPEKFDREKAFLQLKQLTGQMGRIADKYGITIVIEPLNREECNIINTFREGCIFAEQVGDPRIRVLADYYHFSLEQDSIEDLKKYGKQYLRHVHFAETKGRFYPKDKKPEYREFICALQEAGYKGRISCEGYSDDLLTDGKNGIRILTEIWDAATEETK